jgi:hypothetical protein
MQWMLPIENNELTLHTQTMALNEQNDKIELMDNKERIAFFDLQEEENSFGWSVGGLIYFWLESGFCSSVGLCLSRSLSLILDDVILVAILEICVVSPVFDFLIADRKESVRRPDAIWAARRQDIYATIKRALGCNCLD